VHGSTCELALTRLTLISNRLPWPLQISTPRVSSLTRCSDPRDACLFEDPGGRPLFPPLRRCSNIRGACIDKGPRSRTPGADAPVFDTSRSKTERHHAQPRRSCCTAQVCLGALESLLFAPLVAPVLTRDVVASDKKCQCSCVFLRVAESLWTTRQVCSGEFLLELRSCVVIRLRIRCEPLETVTEGKMVQLSGKD
jgi:hypothetical protein